MSRLFDKPLAELFGRAIGSTVERSLRPAVEAALARPGLTEAVERTIEREVDLFAETQLGLPPRLRFTDEFAFFDDYLRPAYETGGTSQDRGWCGHWWAHPSVRFRVRSMWLAYEALARQAPATCDETFLRTIGDHHMPLLTGDRSPMFACATAHQPSKRLKSEPIES